MPGFGKQAAIPAALIAMLATTASAQAKQCEIDEGTPSPIARATLALQLAQGSAKPEDAAGKLREAVKLLTEADKSKNPVGRNWVLGRALTLWMTQPNIGATVQRSTLGYTTDPTGTIDIVAAIDSSFTVVENAMPECVATTAGWRQQKAWVDMVNGAIELVNQDKVDSAVTIATRSLVLFRGAPYGYMVLAQAAARRAQMDTSVAGRTRLTREAVGYYKQTIAAAKDTSQADIRRQMQMALGNVALDAAESATGADKTAWLNEAKAAFDALAKDPGAKYADVARGGLARIASVTGDTAAIKASYQEQLNNPGAFNYASLMNAAVTAARTNQTADATKLFEAAYKVNPYHRDVLYNLGRIYMLDSLWAQGLPYVRQLVSVDPSNPDNYSLMAIGYAQAKKYYDRKTKEWEDKAKALGVKANTAKGAAAKAYIDSAAKIPPFIKLYQDSSKTMVDSAIKYNDLGMKLPVRVTFTEFTPTESKTTMTGQIANNGDAAASYKIKIQFLDKTGNVVDTQEVSVGPVNAHASKEFKSTGNGAGIVAFRYSIT